MDTLAITLNRIKTGGAVKKETVTVPYSNFLNAIVGVLLKEGYIAGITRKGKGPKKTMEIALAYENGKHKIRGIKRVSKSSRRLYSGVRDLKPVRQGTGDLILSTPQGILTGKEARRARVGGETLFEIW